jgi:CheY-like chemotaxis protein
VPVTENKKLILVVDDDDALREVFEEVLTSAGYAVVGVSNALAALEHVARFGPPALVLMDLTMPVMDGRQFLAERRKWATLSHVPFVLLTARSAVDAAELGVAEVLRKPIGIEELLAVARRYASGRSGTYSAVSAQERDEVGAGKK